MKFVITGASGRTSRKIADNLLARGVPAADLIMISRSPERGEVAAYGLRGASLRFGDFTDLATLPEAFAGGERMFFMPMNHPPDEVDEAAVKRAVVRIAEDAGVRYCVYQSIIGAGAKGTEDDLAVEHALAASRMGWVVLRTGIFSESLGRECKRYIREGRIATDDPDVHRCYVTRDDIAAAGAAVLLDGSRTGCIYNIFGGTLTMRELAAALSEFADKQVEIVPAERPDWGGSAGRAQPENDLPLLIGRSGTAPLDQLRTLKDELLTGRAAGAEMAFGFQWQARGQERRPDDISLVMQRLYRAAKAGDACAAAAFGYKLAEHPERRAIWRHIHPEWFWWEAA